MIKKTTCCLSPVAIDATDPIFAAIEMHKREDRRLTMVPRGIH
jgi:hypothetical protein